MCFVLLKIWSLKNELFWHFKIYLVLLHINSKFNCNYLQLVNHYRSKELLSFDEVIFYCWKVYLYHPQTIAWPDLLKNTKNALLLNNIYEKCSGELHTIEPLFDRIEGCCEYAIHIAVDLSSFSHNSPVLIDCVLYTDIIELVSRHFVPFAYWEIRYQILFYWSCFLVTQRKAIPSSALSCEFI